MEIIFEIGKNDLQKVKNILLRDDIVSKASVIFKEAHGLLEDKSQTKTKSESSVVSDLTPCRKVLCYDGLDPVVDALKEKRMRIFQDSRGGGN